MTCHVSDGSLQLYSYTCETLEPAQEMEGDKKPPSSSKFSQFGNQKSL